MDHWEYSPNLCGSHCPLSRHRRLCGDLQSDALSSNTGGNALSAHPQTWVTRIHPSIRHNLDKYWGLHLGLLYYQQLTVWAIKERKELLHMDGRAGICLPNFVLESIVILSLHVNLFNLSDSSPSYQSPLRHLGDEDNTSHPPTVAPPTSCDTYCIFPWT